MPAALPPPDSAAETQQRWAAVQQRDRRYANRFVYAVSSTGIYCRPTCPSRRPHPAKVRFFDRAGDARQAGYRPCRRCQPDAPDDGSIRAGLVPAVCAYIEQRIGNGDADAPANGYPANGNGATARSNGNRNGKSGATAPAKAYRNGNGNDSATAAGRLPTLAELSRFAAVSPSHLQRVFKEETGLTPRQYAQARRLENFKSLVRQRSGGVVAAAALDAGFGAASRLYEKAGEQLGMTPGRYRSGGAGVAIRYVVADSPLGCLLVAATGRGVCAVKLGDAPAPLLSELQAEFPAANLIAETIPADIAGDVAAPNTAHYPAADIAGNGDAAAPDATGDEHAAPDATADITADGGGLPLWVAALLEYLAGRRSGLDLPLDVQATLFQRQVWQLLQAIPYGETRTYRQLAQALGREQHSRAVGQACAANPVSLIVPCHRAVRTGGGLAGFRWGLHRKAALQEMEQGGAAN